jgi:hypothetical protein
MYRTYMRTNMAFELEAAEAQRPLNFTLMR